jgi:glycerophosphoryl diester phosphodiesterase
VRPALVIAHRGASTRAVENSLAAFRAAGPLGADGVELDIHATSDGALIVHHDEAIGSGPPIPELSAAAVRALRLANGEPIPTLPEALDAAGPGLRVFVEVKSLSPRFDERLFDALAHGPNPSGYAVHSFDHRIVRRLGTERPALRRGVLSASYPITPVAEVRAAGATMLWQERQLIDRALADAVHEAGMELIAWTVDDPSDMERLLALGVDALCTNRPEVGRQAVDARPR